MPFTTLRIAFRNLGRNRRRTLLAVAAIALGQLIVVSINGMMGGMFDLMLDTITGPLVGHVQVHHAEWREERAIDLTIDGVSDVIGAIESHPAVRSVSPRVFAPVLAASGELLDEPADAEVALIVGMDIALESEKGGALVDLPQDERPGPGEVVLGRVLATRLGLSPGHQVAVIGQDADEFPVSQLYRIKAVMSATIDAVNRMGVVMPLDEAQTLLAMHDRAHEIIIRADNAEEARPLAAELRTLAPLAGMEVLAWQDAVPELVGLLDMKGWMDIFFVAILFAAAAAGIANTMTMSTFERTHEFGMLLALGTRPRRIARMILFEAIALGLMGVAIGSLIGTAIVLITSHTGIDYGALAGTKGQEMAFQGLNFSFIIYPKFAFRHILYGTVAVTVTAMFAAIWPALFVSRLQPAEAMRS